MNKNDRIRGFQKFLKKSIKWHPKNKKQNLAKEYDNEKYAVVESTTREDPTKFNWAVFVDDLNHAQAILDHDPSYHQIVVDMDTCEIVKRKRRVTDPLFNWWEESEHMQQ